MWLELYVPDVIKEVRGQCMAAFEKHEMYVSDLMPVRADDL